MGLTGLGAAIVFVLLIVVAIQKVFTRRHRGSVGTGAAGAYYDMLNKDQREAIEIIAEKRAEKQDPETRDGNLPDLASRSSHER